MLIDPAGKVAHLWHSADPKVPDRLDGYATIFCSMFMRCKNLYVLMFVVSLSTACVEEAPVPVSSGSDIFLRSDIQIIEEVIPRRATLAGLLNAHALDGQMAFNLIEAIRPVFNPRRIRVGNPYRLVLDDDGTLRRFEYHVDDDQFLRVTTQSGTVRAFDAKLIPYVKERAEISMRGAIDGQHSSLVSAIDGGGESVMLAIRMAEVFAGEIDFSNDLRRGDRFEVLFEKYLREDEFSGYGDILAAEFHNDGRRLQAFSYKLPGDDEPLYYDEQGRSLKRLFLRSPFRFEPRVTSRFSYRRLHPVLGNHRPHLGVDYGASIGTPVIAVANGRVVSAARSGGSGNMIRLRHTNGYETYYLHLSSFATGMRAGSRVVQGQIIGRVGATGLVTGPHLDFRMRKNGTFVNPLIEHRNLPPGDPVPEEHLAEFHEVRERALRRMQLPSRQVNIGRMFTQ